MYTYSHKKSPMQSIRLLKLRWQDYYRDPDFGCDAKEKPVPIGACVFLFWLTYESFTFNIYKTKKPIIKNDYWLFFVGVAGFEPATSASQTRRDNRATLHPEMVIYISFCASFFYLTL